jgi:hypothetical protein
MKILVATSKTQGQRKNDFFFATKGEMVIEAFTCDTDQGDPDGSCGCSRSFVGLKSGKGTTTARVASFPKLTMNQYAEAILDYWVLKFHAKSVVFADALHDAKIFASQASHRKLGAIVERRKTVQTRRIS